MMGQTDSEGKLLPKKTREEKKKEGANKASNAATKSRESQADKRKRRGWN